MPIIELNNHNQKVTIDTFGSQILSWRHNNTPILRENNNQKRSGMPIMFPFCGPLVNSIFTYSKQKIAQHGFARNSNWEVLSQTDSKLELVLNYLDINQEYQQSYPFQFELIFVVEITPNGIRTDLKVDNWDMHELPISPGFHPYFHIQPKDKNKLKISNITFYSTLLPWTTGVEAQFHSNPQEFTIQTPEYTLQCKDNSTLDGVTRVCDLVTVWAGEVDDFVCIEPMSQPFDSINTDPIIVPSLGNYTLSYSWFCQ